MRGQRVRNCSACGPIDNPLVRPASTAVAGVHSGRNAKKPGHYSGFEGRDDVLGAAVSIAAPEILPHAKAREWQEDGMVTIGVNL